MSESNLRQQMMDEIVSRKKLGGKKFHSETSLQQFGEDESESGETVKSPGVLNSTMNDESRSEEVPERRRTMSQPGPGTGSMLTATAARAARRRPQRNVAYAPEPERTESADKQIPKLIILNREDSGSATPTGEPPFNYSYRNGDVKSLNSYRLYTPNDVVKGGTTPRKRSVATMDAQSIRSVETQAPPSTNPEENRRLSLIYCTLILSCIYAIFIVTLGFIIYLVDPLDDGPSISAIYSLILTGIGFIYHIFLMVDISRYKDRALKNQKIRGRHDEKISDFFRNQEENYANMTPIDRASDIYKPSNVPSPVVLSLKHDYCFSQGRHSGSFYLKMGAAGFALGHLIHSVLLIAIQIDSLFDGSINNNECIDITQVVLDFVNPFYCFFQLFFIFKYSNVIILRAQGLARFAFMHMIGSSLCFWISAIVRETVLALTLYANSVYGNSSYGSNETRYEIGGNRFINVSSLYDEKCTGSAALTSIYDNISPYLYPFSVEFNILIVAVYYIIWNNIGNCENSEIEEPGENGSISEITTICKIPTANEENDFTSNIVIHADCHASNKGLFLGLVVMAVIAGMLIIGFVFSSVGENFLSVGYFLSNCMSLGLHLIMLLASILAYNQTRKLDINEHPISLLDDILLFICLPAFFIETILSLVATINLNNIIYTIDFVVMVVQVVIQTALLVDGLRRCSNSRKLRRRKPGRELLIFLLITNVAMWLFNTFSYKSPESLDERYEYYGKVAWTVLGHISLPLIMFYRFHSSVCFADIWNSAYKPGSDH